ncbi:M48 family metallopeptidase [Nafulsella turpanensis]|uniref:M48 family metallopeptidase n=1 Tax=Nafulsella turpanensis TaxID=1265690 RepID=UPI00034C9566|nr:M48 family metallopeptidase [Nafulsella turpanensis]
MKPTFLKYRNYAMSILLLLVLLAVESCSTVPLTGRRQLSLVPASEINAMSFQQYEQVLDTSRLSSNQEWANMVRSVGRDISQAVEQYMREIGEADNVEGFEWEFNLIAEDIINAWAMPGGKVAFYEGIMPIARDKTGVAVVMGHEIAHAIAKHGAERMSLGLAQQLGGATLQAALSQQPQMTQQLAMTAFGLGSQIGVQLPYSREHESEADRLGLMFMAKAGYDPREAPRFWQRMQAKAGGSRPPEFLSTHPNPETRINQLNKYMDEAVAVYQQNR